MFNVLLDPLPTEWNGYPIDTDFQTGIMINQCLNDDALNEREQFMTAISLLFPGEIPDPEECGKALAWYLTEYIHDNKVNKKENEVPVMDFDVDQWRIYAAFLNQYGIDLNTTKMHWFTFMGLLSNLNECSFLHVMEIRNKKITSKMTKEEKAYYGEQKAIFAIKQHREKRQSPQDQKAVEEFMKYANINKRE